MISVVVPTMRVGGLDVLVAGLSGQTDTDFELVVSDGLYRYRRELVAERAKRLPFPLIHCEPRDNPFPVASYCRYANECLVRASGDHVLFITDYTWLPPEAVAVHAAHWRAGASAGLMCPHVYHALPALSPSFPGYEWDRIGDYVADVGSGRLEGLMWSIFEREFSSELMTSEDPSFHQETDGLLGGGVDPKLSLPDGPVRPDFFHAKNASVPLSTVLEANGWDETLDGGHGYQDMELARRLTSRGFQWVLGKQVIARVVNPRSRFPRPSRDRPIQGNEAVWKGREAAGYPTPNDWSLKEARQQPHE